MFDFTFQSENKDAKIEIENQWEQNGILYATVKMTQSKEEIPQAFSLEFKVPAVGMYSMWGGWRRTLGMDWEMRRTNSRLVAGQPVHTLLSAEGENRITVALSDAVNPTQIASGICEEDACLLFRITFFTASTAPCSEYRAVIRIDQRAIPYYDALYDTVEWWEKECGYTPLAVPESAKLPMNSLWYTYHRQLDAKEIIEDCVISKEFGLETVIVDDGWHTEDCGRDFAFCGDWQLATSKFPDMKAFVDQVHAVGMKVMLWFSTCFMGIYTKNFERFKDKLLDKSVDNKTLWALDPRYPECREFIIGNFVRALSEWNLDGLKLDFIDSFPVLQGKSLEYDERRDFQSLEAAVEVLMTDAINALKAVKPDVMIEFRLSYTGPAMRRFGNIFRVGDCPCDSYVNRFDSVNLRLMSGNTVVCSDMLMWNMDDSAESAALQFVNALFTVPQISVKLQNLPEDHKRMLSYYLAFWREHRDVLLDGKLKATHPECGYGLVWTERNGEAVYVSYTDPVIDCTDFNNVVAVNANDRKFLILKGAAGKEYRVVNCLGETVRAGKAESSCMEVEVPLSGMVIVNEI